MADLTPSTTAATTEERSAPEPHEPTAEEIALTNLLTTDTLWQHIARMDAPALARALTAAGYTR